MNNWLFDLYSKHKRWLISGHPSFSERFGLSDGEKVSLLYIANRNQTFAYLITIGFDFENLSKVKKELKNKLSYNIVKMINNIFKSKCHIILFDDEIDTNRFSVTRDFFEYTNMNSTQLIEYFRRINPEIVRERGTTTDVNERLNDNFHEWSRENLGRYIVKNDFDILSLSPLMNIELIKTSKNIEEWKPHVTRATCSNFRCLKNITNENNIHFLVIGYQISRENEVSVNRISEVCDRSKYIKGRKFIDDPNHIAILNGTYDINEGVGEYISRRRNI